MNTVRLNYLSAAGERAQTTLPLTYWTIGVAVVVCTVIAALLVAAVRHSAARRGGSIEMRNAPLVSGGRGIKWISVGVGVSLIPLLVTLVWTMVALAKESGPPGDAPLTLDITALQWWWQVQYDAAVPDQSFITANEIHIPVGRRVLVRLHGGDVIHSFWVPQLAGKTDLIPGQVNVAWLQAARPGRFRGQCGEYCGFQHSHMQFEVVADAPADFERWRAHQLEDAPAPMTPEQARGLQVVEYRCGLCHEVRGTTAGAITAPDLTHLMSRRTIAAGMLPTGVGTLGSWIEAAQELKPGTLMPDQHLSANELSDTLAYLETLR